MELCESFKLNHWIRVYPSYLHTLFPFDYLTHELFIGWGLLICSCARNFDQFSFPKSLLFSYSWWTIVLGTKSWTQLNTHARTFLKHVNRVFWSMVHCTETLDLISWESKTIKINLVLIDAWLNYWDFFSCMLWLWYKYTYSALDMSHHWRHLNVFQHQTATLHNVINDTGLWLLWPGMLLI